VPALETRKSARTVEAYRGMPNAISKVSFFMEIPAVVNGKVHIVEGADQDRGNGISPYQGGVSEIAE
jgi:hypothetical protein